jgi:hypothetical protein
VKGAFAVGQKFHGRGFTAFLVGVAQGQKGRIFGEFPAHETGALKDGVKRVIDL